MIRNLLLIISCLSAVIGFRATAEVPNLTHSSSQFALELYKELQTEKGNLLFSPYSISTALAMTYAGARGSTAKEMSQVLKFPLDQTELHLAFANLQSGLNAIEKKGQVQLRIANSLWPQIKFPILPGYLSLIKNNYGVDVKGLDYQNKTEESRLEINQWVEAKTENKIKDLIPKDLDPLTRLILVNAIYFKGNWALPFNPEITSDGSFYLNSKEERQVPLMKLTDSFGYHESAELQVLEMLYQGNDLSLLVFLPKNQDGLAQLEADLTNYKLDKWQMSLKPREVQVVFPKIKIESDFDLSKSLAQMGMSKAFSEQAEFDGITGKEHALYISKVLHKAFLEINETGTEAAAATATIMMPKSAVIEKPSPLFRADHPFLFAIKDKASGMILFIGRVVNPK